MRCNMSLAWACVLLVLQKVIGMAVRAGMLFAALSLAKTSPHRRPVEMMLVLIWVMLIRVRYQLFAAANWCLLNGVRYQLFASHFGV